MSDSTPDDTEQISPKRPLVTAETIPGSVEGRDISHEDVPDFFSAGEIFQRVLATADEELSKDLALLFWSGVAAGGALGFSFLARVIFTAATPGDTPGLVDNIFYPIGFVMIVLGRYQLFTENTLTPVTLVLPRLASLPRLLKLWGVVFAANILGAVGMALLLANAQVFDERATVIAIAMGNHLLDFSWISVFARAILAGWLVGSMVWLVHSSRDNISRIVFVWLIMYLIGAAELFHCITNSLELFYLAFNGGLDTLAFFTDFMIPVTLGNIVGGVVFVAILNYMQINRNVFDQYGEKLSLERWFLKS